MSEDKKIKHCVGAIIYTLEGKILLITSKKWNNGNVWLVPGGQMEAGETEEETLRREIREELNLELNTITKCGEKWKEASTDFKNATVTFHFIDFFAEAKTMDITPNDQIDS